MKTIKTTTTRTIEKRRLNTKKTIYRKLMTEKMTKNINLIAKMRIGLLRK